MSGFTFEKKIFQNLRSNCPQSAKKEFESVIARLIEQYNTTIYENRFIAGGAVEVFVYALLRSVGTECHLFGSQAKSGDIMLPNSRFLSVKGTFTGGPSNVKLINQLGSGERHWKTATLFVVSEVGIVFGTPEMVESSEVRNLSDGVELTRKGLTHLIKQPQNVFEIEIVRKPPTEMAGKSLRASHAVAKQVLEELKAEHLLKAFEW